MTHDARAARETKGDEEVAGEVSGEVSGAPSHRDVAARVAGAERFAVTLPLLGRVPIPRPDQLAFYAALAGLVAVELVEWPVAVAIGAGHALVSQRRENPHQTG